MRRRINGNDFSSRIGNNEIDVEIYPGRVAGCSWRSAGHCFDQSCKEFLLGDAGAPQVDPFRTRWAIGAALDFCIHRDIRAHPVDGLHFHGDGVTPARPTARVVVDDVRIVIQF